MTRLKNLGRTFEDVSTRCRTLKRLVNLNSRQSREKMNLPGIRCCKKSTPVGVYQQETAIHFTFFKLISVICARPRKNEQTSMDQVCLVFLFSAVASWLTRSTSRFAASVLGRALVGNIVLCSWANSFTLTMRVFTQVYK